MLAFPNEHKPPFSDIPAALQPRHLNELVARLADEGIQITGETPDDALIINLSELAVRSGSLERGRANLYGALDALNIAAVSLSPDDVIALLGRNPIAWGVARGLESNIPGVANLLRTCDPRRGV
jgi:hypothetical protein